MKAKFLLHPLLWFYWPILFFYTHNISSTRFSDTFTSTLTLLGIALFLFLLFLLLYRNWHKTALATSLALCCICTYGHAYEILTAGWLTVTVNHRLLLLAYLAISGSLLYLLYKTKSDLKTANQFATILALLLLTTNCISLIAFNFRNTSFLEETEPAAIKLKAPPDKPLPSIYYFILDGYARADVLQDIYQYDNSDIIHFLEQKGFQVPRQSTTNYNQTFLSLASSLNLRYLTEFKDPKATTWEPVSQLIRDNKVFNFLRKQGYTVITFSSGWDQTEVKDADYFIAAPNYIDEFTFKFFQTTIWRTLNENGRVWHFLHHNPFLKIQRLHANEDRYFAFDTLSQLPALPEPKFIFAHTTITHEPFVFGSQGQFKHELGPVPSSFKNPQANQHYVQEFKQAYTQSITFTNSKIKKMVTALLKDSSETKIIIIQADHGPRSSILFEPSKVSSGSTKKSYVLERMPIFSAVYLPGKSIQVPATLTPVNIFRLIFRNYFNAEISPLSNKHYISAWEKPYLFDDVTPLLKENLTSPVN